MNKHKDIVHFNKQRELRHSCDLCEYKAKDLHLLVK
jgi:C4-type Zn-finger protein